VSCTNGVPISLVKKYQPVNKAVKPINSNSIIPELNATVLSATFKSKKGIQKADLYTYKGTVCANPDEVVSHGTCAPVVAIFVKTIEVEFKD
jgi:hypothetical protein